MPSFHDINAPRLTIEDTLHAILESQLRIVDLLEQRAATTSEVAKIEVENMAKGPPKITSRSYDGSVLTRELVDQHLEAHAYATAQAEKMQMAGWEQTVRLLEERDAGPEQEPDFEAERREEVWLGNVEADPPRTAPAVEPTPFDDLPGDFAEVSPGVHLPRRR